MALSSTLFACRHSRPMASLSSDLVQRSPWSAGHRATPCPGCPGQDWWDFGDDQHLKMIMMSTITLEHWCPGLDWWDFGDNNYDISEWSGPWWSPWRMNRTIMITLENYQWCVFDSELHDAIGGEEQSWELSRCWAGFQIVNIAIILWIYPGHIVNIVIIFWILLK